MDSGIQANRGSNLQIAKEIFRAYDIRGVVDESLTVEAVQQIGSAIGTKVLATGNSEVVVGRDGRLSGERLSQALVAGIQATGCTVYDIGMVPTPVLYFATKHLQVKSAVMLTGSHNPVNYNGLKMIIDDVTIYGEQIQELYSLILQQKFASGSKGAYVTENVMPAYIEAIKGNVHLKRSLKIVLDAGNGVAGLLAPKLYAALGCQVVPLYCEVDGSFPNHHPDPGNPENLVDLIREVVDQDADIGLAFDGDGDRLGIIDNQGKIIWADRALMLFAQQVLACNPGGTIIYDVKCSRDLHNVISKSGGEPLMWNTGHSLIKAKMRATNACLAAEMSGHIFFKDRWYGFDDGLYAGARLLEILAATDLTSAELFASFPEKVSTPEINIRVTEANKFKIMQQLVATANFSDSHELITIDGMRVEFANGWGLLRPSNTTPNLVARFEATDQESLKHIQQQFRRALLDVSPELELSF